MVDIKRRLPCTPVDRVDDVMRILEYRLRVRVHLVDEDAPKLFSSLDDGPVAS